MTDYISREAFIEDKRKQYCSDCNKRKGLKKGKFVFCYEIGEAPCRSCGIDDMLTDVEDYPAADVRPVVRAKWEWNDNNGYYYCGNCEAVSPREDQDGEYIDCPNFCPNCGADMREESK